MRVVGDQLCDDTFTPKCCSYRLFPQFDRAPRLPQEIPRTNQNVVSGGDAWQRPCVMVCECDAALGESVDVGGIKLFAFKRRKVMLVEAVQQNDNDILGLDRHGYWCAAGTSVRLLVTPRAINAPITNAAPIARLNVMDSPNTAMPMAMENIGSTVVMMETMLGPTRLIPRTSM